MGATGKRLPTAIAVITITALTVVTVGVAAMISLIVMGRLVILVLIIFLVRHFVVLRFVKNFRRLKKDIATCTANMFFKNWSEYC